MEEYLPGLLRVQHGTRDLKIYLLKRRQNLQYQPEPGFQDC